MSTTEFSERLRANLLATLSRLAAEPEAQRQYLSRLGVAPNLDELALEFDAAWAAARSSAPSPVAEACEQLDRALTSMSGEDQESLWSFDALEGPAWVAVRDLARVALEQINAH